MKQTACSQLHHYILTQTDQVPDPTQQRRKIALNICWSNTTAHLHVWIRQTPEYFLKTQGYFADTYSRELVGYKLHIQWLPKVWDWENVLFWFFFKENELILQQKKLWPFAHNNSHDQWHKFDLEIQNQKCFLFICCQ